MKLFYTSLLLVCTCFTLYSMNHPTATWRLYEVTELADVPMAAVLVPSPTPMPPLNSTPLAQPSTPGILQALHDTITRRQPRTN